MKKQFKKLTNHPLVSGSAIIFLGTLFANFLNFIFNLFMSRNLSVIDYGILASLISIILIFALIADSFVPTVVHFAGSFIAKNEEKNLLNFFSQINKICLWISIITVILIIICSRLIGVFFNIENNYLVMLVGIIVFFGFISLPNRGIIQAKLLFKYISFINFASALSKLVVGAIAVVFGLKVFGALLGFLSSFVLQYILTFIPLKKYYPFKKGNSPVVVNQVVAYGGPAAMALIFLTFFITSDLILVKHFFSPEDAGVYAGLSLIGRVIFFFSAPISTVMFPLVVNKKAKNEEYRDIFKIAILLIFLLSLSITIFYYLFPEFTIKLFLKKDDYLVASSFLGFFGVFITLYSMLAVVTNFYLSVRNTKIFIPIAIGAFAQSTLIWIFHNSFGQIITISIITVSLTLLILLLYYLWRYERKTRN